MNVRMLARSLVLVAGALSLLTLVGCASNYHPGAATGATDTLAVSPTVSVDAVVNGGRQSVSLSFNAPDSSTLTDLKVTAGLSSLPAGWSGPSSFTCATVSTGSGCLLNLVYAPTVVASGALQIQYSYTDSAGAAQTGTATVNYAGTTNNNIVATVSPTGQIVATVAQGSQLANIAFTTDDGNSASAFTLTTDLGTLPAGWSSAAKSLTCGSVSTGNGCHLALIYAPPAPASGTLSLTYAYKDNSGDAKTGTVVIRYSATANDNIVGTVAPTGQIGGPVGNAAQAVAVTFTTDDGFPATDLSVTSGLSSLPVGWSSSVNTLTCPNISTGAGCRLTLSFTPTATATGTLSLGYAYTNNAGTAKTGTVNIAYLSSSHNTVLGTPNPPGTVRVKVGLSKQIQLVFTTNDGNTATHFKVTSDLTALPAGWSGTNGFACDAVNSGTGCSLPLSYAPVANATGILTLDISYTDSAFTAQTGTVTVSYSNPHLYLYDNSVGAEYCAINVDGSTAGCATTGSGVTGEYGSAAFAAGYAYLPDNNDAKLFICTLDPVGTISNCADSGYTFSAIGTVVTDGSYLYVANDSDGVYTCAISAPGTLASCALSATVSGASGLALDGDHLYVATYGSVYLCIVGTDGSVGNCQVTGGSTINGVSNVRVSDGFIYGSQFFSGKLTICPINPDGTLATCANSTVSSSVNNGIDVAVNGTDLYFAAYVSGGQGIYHCALDPSVGAISNCQISDGGINGSTSDLLAIGIE
jgi:hypothetical protein